MFLYNMKTDCMICDFQLVYESDGRLMFDLYAYGQVKETSLLKIEAVVNFIDCGLVSVSCNDFKKIESKLDNICRDKHLLGLHARIMHQKIIDLISKCKKMEKCFAQENVSLETMYEGFDALTDVIAYRRLADMASDLLSSEIGVDRLVAMRLPSYLVLFQEELNKLGHMSSSDEIELFIREYGYLAEFSVLENIYENADYVKEYAADKKGNGQKVAPLSIAYEPLDEWTINEKIFYELSWYSECKHIYQLRVLRNLRKYMELCGFDVIKTDARSLFKNVSAFKIFNREREK